MADDTAFLKVLTTLANDLREVGKDLARAGSDLTGDSRDQIRQIQYRVEAMRRYYEHLSSVLQADPGDDDTIPILRPATGSDSR